MAENGFKCGHAPCKCTVSSEGDYCGDHCRKAAANHVPETLCGCGHPPCGTSPQARPEEQSDG